MSLIKSSGKLGIQFLERRIKNMSKTIRVSVRGVDAKATTDQATRTKEPTGPVPFSYPCKIVRVIDGDSIVVDIDLGFSHWIHNESIRLYGVDTPECRTRDAEEKAAGLLAKEFVEDTLHVGGTYMLQTKEKGKFGRFLGVIFIQGSASINAALISENLAVPYTGQSKKEVQAEHEANYKILKDKGFI